MPLEPSAVSRKRLALHKGRSGGDSAPFARLPVEVLESPACVTLPHVAHRVLVAVAAQYSGRGNGSLSMTKRRALQYGIRDPHALGATLRELEARGLLVKTRLGTHVPPRSAFFALGWLPIDEPLAHDRHESKATLHAPDSWRTWQADIQVPHWVTERRDDRRAPRFSRRGVSTSMGGASPSNDTEMGGASPSIEVERLVGRPALSQISSRAGPSMGRYLRFGVVHLKTCPAATRAIGSLAQLREAA